MADEIDRLIGDLETSFSASVAREEELAARDLTRSLLQDIDLAELLSRWPAAAIKRPDGGLYPIEEIGRDFLATEIGGALMPSEGVVLVRLNAGRTPRPVDETMVIRLRRWAAEGVKVQVETLQGHIEIGMLGRVSPDHLEIATTFGPLVVALKAISSIRSLGGG